MKTEKLTPIFVAGLVAGVLDLAFAAYLAQGRGVPMQHMLQSIASGLIGETSYTMGWPAAAIGVICHFGIALAMSFTFYAIALRKPFVLRNATLSATVYGAALYLVMEFLVVPLSNAPFTLRQDAASVTRSLISHIFFVAYPIVIASRCTIGKRTRC